MKDRSGKGIFSSRPGRAGTSAGQSHCARQRDKIAAFAVRKDVWNQRLVRRYFGDGKLPEGTFLSAAGYSTGAPASAPNEQPPYAASVRTAASVRGISKYRRSTPCFSKRRRRCLGRLLTQPCSVPP